MPSFLFFNCYSQYLIIFIRVLKYFQCLLQIRIILQSFLNSTFLKIIALHDFFGYQRLDILRETVEFQIQVMLEFLFQCREFFGRILQAGRVRTSKTEYISCPGCGRTLYDLESTIARIKAATSHLKGLKIGIMGCIVNGPGEMADADYGYVGAGRGKVSLYKKKECIEKNIPEEQAVEKLIELIRSNGDYIEK